MRHVEALQGHEVSSSVRANAITLLLNIAVCSIQLEKYLSFFVSRKQLGEYLCVAFISAARRIARAMRLGNRQLFYR